MTQSYIVTGTDTNVGKTVFAAGLAAHLGARYWKPVQAGVDDGTDAQTVRQLAGPNVEILAEAYRLKTACSPHQAARIDGVEIALQKLALPEGDTPLVVEGAGGVLVPFTDDLLAVELFAVWDLPVILVARTSLGTINHSLLSIDALRAYGVQVHGIVFIGDENPVSESTITRLGKVRHLGRLPWLDPLTPDSLAQTFALHIRTEYL